MSESPSFQRRTIFYCPVILRHLSLQTASARWVQSTRLREARQAVPSPTAPTPPSPPPHLERTARLPVLPAEKDSPQSCPCRQTRRHMGKFPKWKAGAGVSVCLRACRTARAWTADKAFCPAPSSSSGPHPQPGTWGGCPGV